MRLFLVVIFFVICNATHVCAQQYGSTTNLPKIDTSYSEPDTTPRIKRAHSPNVAAGLSALIPGAGQAFNKKYWKIPIIYAGFITGYYLNRSLNASYKTYKNLYDQNAKIYTSQNEIPPSDAVVTYNGASYSLGSIQQARDYYRRYRDLTIIGLSVWYALNIIDATVDAYFYEYDISNNLSVKFIPNIIYGGAQLPVYTSLTIRCSFKK